MSKVLAVFGATGQQGGSLVEYVLNDPELSQEYQIRAITRDTSSPKAKGLKNRVEVVTGDATDPTSLKAALEGVHTIFAMTQPTFGPDSYQIEYESGKAIADAAVEQGCKYIIFSTLPPVKEISGGKYTSAHNFDSKAAVEQYIRKLPIKSAFYNPGEFMENFHGFPVYAPKRCADGTWVITRHLPSTSKSPLVSTVADTGKFIGAILADPEKYEGETFAAATAWYTQDEIAAIISKSTGETVTYQQLPLDEYRKGLPPFLAELFADVLSFAEEYGYWGAGSEDRVAWAVQNARGKLTTFEKYLEANPLKLE